MKKLKKSRVSWRPYPMLCQVKLFSSDDCPAKVASHPRSKNSVNQSPDFPPGFEGNHYLDIPQIKWNRPPKFVVNASWRLGVGDESSERQTENLRIAKVFEAIYPHRSAIPSRPSVKPGVEGECYDDSKTPIIRATPIEDDREVANGSSQTDIPVNRQSPLKPKPPSSTQEQTHATVSGHGADTSLAASAFLTALMKMKEQRNMIDPELLVKFLSDPKMVQNLINDRMDRPSEAENYHVDLPNHVPNSAVDGIPQHLPLKQTFAASQPCTYLEPTRVSPPRSGNGNLHVGLMPALSYSSVAMERPLLQPSHETQMASSTIPPNLNLHKPALPISTGPKCSHNVETDFAKVPMNPNGVIQSSCSSMGIGVDIRSYQMNSNEVEVTVGGKVGVKSEDYFKKLIRKHGRDKGRKEGRDYNKKQKACIYFGSTRGCRLGDSCLFLHDHPSINPKRTKFGT